MATDKFDIIVIGGGPGGYVAAIRASQLGMKTALVEEVHLGGVCLNWGCIPTKTLLKSSEINHLLHNLDIHGFSADNIKFDLTKIINRSRKVSKKLSGGVAYLLKKNNVKVIDGHARLVDTKTVSVTNGDNISKFIGNNIIISTGAHAKKLNELSALGEEHVWTYKEAMIPTEIPNRILIVGSGAIGIEFASFYHHMGSQVTVAEVVDRILPSEDEEIASMAHKSFAKQGIQILTNTKIKSAKKEKNGLKISLSVSDKDAVDLEFDKIISAVGIVGNVDDIGLEGLGIKVKDGHISTDKWGKTNIDGIYAIGDVAGPPWLAHKASHEGVVCVENLMGLNPHPIDTTSIPGCIYSLPQIASVGLTESDAKNKNIEINIGRFPYSANGKAMALGETEGLIKTIFDSNTGELLGAHLIGAEVTELIHGYVTAKNLETTSDSLVNTIYPHPTLSEAMHESVLDSLERAIHI